MSKELISKSSVDVCASLSKIWEALVDPEMAKKYFSGAEIVTDWTVGSPISFIGEFDGNPYEEKGMLLNVEPDRRLKYTHWSHFDGLPDEPGNYRTWTFDIDTKKGVTQLSITEDNIPTEKQKRRSDEFWADTLLSIKRLVESK